MLADQGLVRGRRMETVDIFAQTVPAEHKVPVDIDSVFYMLSACTGFTDKRFDTSKYDYPFMGFDADAIAATVPELVRNNNVVSLQGLVALLVNAVNDLHTRVSALENK